MKIDENFQMRRLTPADLEEFNALLRYAFQVTTTDMSKIGWSEEEIMRDKFPMLTRGYVLAWFHNERLASQIVIYPMTMNVEGKIIKMGGITGVATYPEYAGRGLVHSLMEKCLIRMREEGQNISVLYPYSIPFYRKMGWEIISDKLTYNIRDTQLPKPVEVSGMMERVEDDETDLKRVHQAFVEEHHGAMVRNDLAWREYWRWDSDDIIAAIYYDALHEPKGYIVYQIEEDTFHIKEIIALNQEAKQGIWNYISAHFSMVSQVKGANYSGEPLAFSLEDSEITETIRPYIMARIVDVAAFVRDYNWQITPEGMRIDFEVSDPLASWNNGIFRVSWEQERTRCEEITREEAIDPIKLSIQTLTTMLMGYKRPSYLFENNRLDMDEHWVRILEQLIYNDKPYFSDYF